MRDYAAEAVRAHQEALAAQARMAELAQQRDEAVRVALEHGVSVIALAGMLGLTRQRIYTMARNAKETP